MADWQFWTLKGFYWLGFGWFHTPFPKPWISPYTALPSYLNELSKLIEDRNPDLQIPSRVRKLGGAATAPDRQTDLDAERSRLLAELRAKGRGPSLVRETVPT